MLKAKLNSITLVLASTLLTSHAYAEQEEINASSNEQEVENIIVRGFHTEDASSLLRNGLALQEVARTVQIFNADTIEELKPAAIEDVLRFSANTAFQGDSDGRSNVFSMRGFEDAPILRDGFRVETFGGITDPELYNLEQIEVLKGPDSILYGESNPGGIINMRSKRPMNKSHGEVQIDIGSYSLFSPKVDVGNKINDSLSFRAVALYMQDDTFRDYDNKNERTFFAPSLRWDINDYTSITFLGEFTDDDFHADFGTVISPQGELLAPIGQVNNHPQDTIDRHQYTYGIDASHSLNENWQINARARVYNAGYEYSGLFLPFRYNFESNTYLRVPAVQGQQNDEHALQLSSSGDFMLGNFRNRLVVGIDYRDSDTVNITRFDPSIVSPLDWLNPDYSELPPNTDNIPVFPTTKDKVKRLGVFAQNHLNLSEELVLSFGVRRDDVERTPQSDSTSTAQDLSNTSLQASLSYELNDHYSLFVAYSESFLPNFDLDKNNQVIDPEEGSGYEIGIKGFELFDNISFTLSYYDIEKSNVSMPDITAEPNDVNPFGAIASGTQSSNGIELEWHGSITDNWRLNANFGTANTDDMGTDIRGAADKTASIWTNYDVYSGDGVDLAIGGGINYLGERFVTADPNGDGDSSDALYLDSHTLVSVYAKANWGNWSAQINLQNLTDETYITAARSGLNRSVHPGAPFTAVGSITYTF